MIENRKGDKIRYKYRPEKFGARLAAVVCPICGHPINWIKPIESYQWAHEITLLAECWSGNTEIEKPGHLFLIHIDDKTLPVVEISKLNKKGEG